jgi:putative ABC transport system substrate-binding protein
VKRRDFMGLLGGAGAAWPVRALAQRAGKVATVGFLDVSADSGWSAYFAAFAKRLNEVGWIEGRTITIEHRLAEGRRERYSEIAAEFVRLKVDVIVTGGIAVPATKQATSTIPIVFAVANDPVGLGLVSSLSRPGGNVTGLSLQAPDLIGKRVELLREALPDLSRMAVMGNVAYPTTATEMSEVRATASRLGVTSTTLELRRPEDIEPAFEALKNGEQALFVCNDGLVNANHARINSLALTARLPTMHAERLYAQSGGLMSYAANYPALFRRAADFVDKILRGTSPRDIPVEQPTKFELVINLKTAKALNLTIPDKLLAIADEVVD